MEIYFRSLPIFPPFRQAGRRLGCLTNSSLEINVDSTFVPLPILQSQRDGSR